MQLDENSFPRRNRVDLFTPAEKAIYDAQQAVESMPAHVLLTEAGNLLEQARDKVADFIERREVVFHNCKPADESALVVSVNGEQATADQLGKVCELLNLDEEVRQLIAKKMR